MAGADLALITLHDRSLGVMSPSKLHANLAAGLPVLYVGPEGSNVDDAITRYAAGRSLREGDVDGVVQAVRELRTDAGASEPRPSRLRGGLLRRRHAPPARPSCSTPERAQRRRPGRTPRPAPR